MAEYADRKLANLLRNRMAMARCDLLRLDAAFVDLCGKQVPPHSHPWLVESYANHWIQGMRQEPVEHAKQQTGRYTANQWLLGLMKAKHLKAPTGAEMQALRMR